MTMKRIGIGLMVLALAGAGLAAAGEVSLPPAKLTALPEGLRAVAKAAGAGGEKALKVAGYGRIEGIRVGAKAGWLRFVQTHEPGPELVNWKLACAIAHRNCEPLPAPPVVLRYYVRYADGVEVEVRVRWDEGIQDAHRAGVVPELLWAKPVVGEGGEGPRAAMYVMEWPNPRPEVTIESLAVVSGSTSFQDWGRSWVVGVETVEGPVAGRRFYVAPWPLGDDANEGTWAKPWSTPQKATEVLEPGDTVYFRGGVYPLTEHVVPRRSGREGAPITYSAYPGESPRLDAAGIMRRADQTPSVKGPNAGPYARDDGAMHIELKAWIRVRGLRIENAQMHGIKLGMSTNSELAFNTTYRTLNCGIALYGGLPDAEGRRQPNRGTRVIGNRVVRAGWIEAATDPEGRYEKWYKGPREALDIAGTEGCEVAYNQVSGSYKEGIDPLGQNTDLEVHHNYVHHTWGAGIYNDSRGATRANPEYAYNIVHDCQNGISINAETGRGHIEDAKVHHNVVWNSWGTGIGVYGPDTTQVAVWNNTSCANGHRFRKKGAVLGGIMVMGGGVSNILVRDNLCGDNAQVQLGTDNVDAEKQDVRFEGNWWWPPLEGAPRYVPGRHVIREAKDPKAVKRAIPFVAAEVHDYRPSRPLEGDRGAIRFEAGLAQGHGFDGTVLATFHGGWAWRPVQIPWRCLNARVHHLAKWGSWFNPPGWHKHHWDALGLPTGRAALGGVEWEIPDWRELDRATMMMLDGWLSTVDAKRIEGIGVGAKAEAVCFLQTYQPSPALAKLEKGAAAPTLWRYVIHYADGQEAEVPVVWGRHVGDWLRGTHGIGRERLEKLTGNMWLAAAREPADFEPPTEARVAWAELAPTAARGPRRGRKRGSPASVRYVALYSMRWENERPEVAISSIDIVSGNDAEQDWGAPAILAITTGTRLPE
jgi:hypothetical protein